MLRKNYHKLLNQIAFVKPQIYILSFNAILIIITLGFIALMFAPWIQTSSGNGIISTLNPEEREQPILATINGRINKWYVHDGQFVKKGESIVELIDLDPLMISRLNNDIELTTERINANEVATNLSYNNYKRQQTLWQQGLTSRKDMEAAQITYQKNLGELKYYKSLLIKSKSDLNKQKNQIIYANRDGYVINTLSSSSTTVVKSGDLLANFISDDITPIAEIYVSGNDIPLIKKGQKVRLVFDGWPAIQFSGWPSISIGTFPGIVYSADFVASANGKFRVLVGEDPHDIQWPEDRFLRYGSQARGYIAITQVSLGFELWRQFNGFPISINHTVDQNFGGKTK